LNLRKVIEIVATRCQTLRLKCTKIDFGWGSAPDPTGRAYSAPPDPLAGIKGERDGKGKDEKGKRRKGRKEGEGEGRRGEEREREGCRKREEKGERKGKGETRHTNPNLLPAPLDRKSSLSMSLSTLELADISSLQARHVDLSVFLRNIYRRDNCLHHLLPPPRDPAVTFRLRKPTVYARTRLRTKR